MKKLKFGVVGCGQIARDRMIPAILRSEKAELVAIADVDEQAVKTTAATYQVPHYYRSLGDLLQNDLIEAVYIATPNYLHCEHAITCANSGKHVLCEKPMAVNVEEGKRMIESFKRNKVKLMVAYMTRFNEATLHAKQLIANGSIGKPIVVQSQFGFVKTLRGKDDWRLDSKKAGGGCLMDVGVYPIDTISFLLDDKIIEVMAFSGNIRFKYPMEDVLITSFKLSRGGIGGFVCGYSVSIPSSFEVYGTEGSIILTRPFSQFAVGELQLIRSDKKEKYEVGLSDPLFACYQRELEHFCECIAQDKEPQPNGQVGLSTIKVIESIYKSVELRTSIEVTDC